MLWGGGMKDEEHLKRSDFLRLIAGSAVLVGSGVFLLPAVRTLRLKPDVDWNETNVEFPISGIGIGEQEMLRGLSEPILVIHRSPEVVTALRDLSTDQRIDQAARLPTGSRLAADEERTTSRDGRFIVVNARCSLGDCIVQDDSDNMELFCPCCSSRYDLSGRVLRGPAKQDLAIPQYRFNAEETVVFVNSFND